MKTIKIKVLMVFFLTLIVSLSIVAFSTVSVEQAPASCVAEQVHEYSYNSHSGIDLDKFNLATEKEDVPQPNYHTTSQMNSAIGVTSNCTGNGSFCPGTCNAYQYVGYHYGATTIPYRIEQSAIDEPGLETLIVQATANWNATRIYNSSGQAVQIVNLVRNGPPASGRPVVTVSYGGTHATLAGMHQAGSSGDMSSSAITYYNGGRNIGTVQHEFGHVLGLDDLDENNPTVSDRHRTVLMGYSRTTSAIQYQDIQGAALFNLAHTTHTFTRFDSNNSNREICFYCDGFRTRPSSYSSQALADESTCIHTYRQMVSAGDRHWHKCTKCYKVVESEFMIQGLTATTLKVIGFLNTNKTSLTIPVDIGGQSVVAIGPSAFADQTQLTQITLPSTVTSIRDSAFENCTNLTSITGLNNVQSIGEKAFKGCSSLTTINIPAGVTSIGGGAFAGCNNLNMSVSPSNPNYLAENNILYNKSKSKIIGTGNISSNITIPSTVTEIAPYAFDGNNKLTTLHIDNTPTIGMYAFANCANLTKAYFYSYTVPIVGANAFMNNNFTLYVPHSKQQIYNSAFVGYMNSIDSIAVEVTFVSEGINVGTQNTYFGATISGLVVPFKLGYDFAGWYNNANFTGTAYANGGLWNMTEDMTLYAKFTPKKYYIIFDGTGSENLEDKEVTYDSPIGSMPTIDLEGKTFAGWKNSRNEYYTEDTIWKDLNNVTLTSDVFSASYIVTLDKQGGDGGSSRVDPIYLEAMPSATAPTRDGYTFQGYFTQPNGMGTKYYNANMSSVCNWDIAQDRELFAYWIGIQSEIILNHENGVGINAQLTSTSSANIIYTSFIPSYSGTITLWTSYTSGDPYLYLYNSSFSQLAYDDDGYGNQNSKITYNVTAGLTYVVGFRAYGSTTVGSVYYSGVGLSSSSRCDRVKATYGSPLPTSGLATPQKTGYSFNGYYTQKEGYGDKFYDGPTVTSLGEWDKQSSIILYANYEKKYYNITLNLDYTSYNDSISIGYGDVVTADGQNTQYVFNRIGYDFKGFYSGRNGTGTKYFDYEIEYLYSDYCYQLISENQRWYNSFDGEIYAYWTKISEKYRYPVVISNADEVDRYFHTDTMTHDGNITITAPTIDGYTFSKMWVNGYDREGSSYTIENVQLKRNLGYGIDGYEDSLPFYMWYPGNGYPQMNQGGLFMVYTRNECVAEGTLITLADGSQKAVETLIGNEILLVWDLRTGTFGYAPILFIDTDSASNYKIIHAYFSDGTDVKVIGEHAFFDFNLNKYVFFRDDAAQYIGNWYNKQTTDANGNMTWTRVQLVDVQIYTEYTTSWSPVTFEYLCYYVNGMLSMPGATTGLINIFDVDGNTMQYDAKLFELDIETYGLFTYEEFVEMFNVPEYIFEAFNARYLKISIGKGLITVEQLGCLIERYAEFFQDQNVEDDCSTDEFCRHNKHHGNGNNQGNSNGRKIGHNKNYRST